MVERDGYFFFAGGIAFAALVVVAATWATRLLSRPVSPLEVTFVAVAAIAILAAGVWRRLRRGRRDELGLKGELTTGEWLTELVADGYRVFHDLQGPRGNIDHVAVGPAGIFVIETKARSKRPGDAVQYDGRRLLVGSWDATEQHLGQARACRDEVRRRLRDYSDLVAQLPVRAVLVYPGWDVPERESSGAEVWVLNPKRRVAAWIRQEERLAGTCSAAQVNVAIAMLDAWARERPDRVEGRS